MLVGENEYRPYFPRSNDHLILNPSFPAIPNLLQSHVFTDTPIRFLDNPRKTPPFPGSL